jgi:hypothetical protein
MHKADQTERLGVLVQQARRIAELGHPTTAHLLRYAGELRPEEVGVLGRWQLRDARGEAVVDRVANALDDSRQVVRHVMSEFLYHDVWGDYELFYQTARESYLTSLASGRPRFNKPKDDPKGIYTFLSGIPYVWNSMKDEYFRWDCDDDEWYFFFSGYLVAENRAYLTRLDLLEVSVEKNWEGWSRLWRFF